jgi:hypothetical protein
MELKKLTTQELVLILKTISDFNVEAFKSLKYNCLTIIQKR